MFKRILLGIGLVALLASCQQANIMDKKIIDWQGHRGARGLVPENTIPAFMKALEYPAVRTLELDLAVTKDSQLVVSHEPWMNALICTKPDGTPVSKEEERSLAIYQMDYETVKSYDSGSKGNANFPEQQAMATYKPTLKAMVNEVEAHVKAKGLAKPYYNIEIKSEPEWDSLLCPPPATFARMVVEELHALGISDRANIQSFDMRPLREVRSLDHKIRIALLVYLPKTLEEYVEELGFTPEIYSPNYRLLSANVVDEAHDRGMKVIPWTVNETTLMDSLLQMGVDGIITDYPDRIPAVY